MLSRTEVIAVYKSMLNREPESEEVISHQIATYADVLSLCRVVARSEEFRALSGYHGTDVLGRHLQALRMNIDLRTTSGQRRSLLAHVQREWTRLGEDEPYWSVLTDEQFRIQRLGQQEMRTFFDSGSAQVEQLERFCERNGVKPRAAAALELGCGLGRISIPMARKFSRLHALDVSSAHLRLARSHAMDVGASNISFIQLREIDQMRSLPLVDLCYSIIVLQHNPPPVIEGLIEALCRRLRNGGLLMIQVPTYMKGYSYSTESYLSNPPLGMEMHCLPQAVIFRILHENGLRVLEVQEDAAVDNIQWTSQTFFAQRKIGLLNRLKQKLSGGAG